MSLVQAMVQKVSVMSHRSSLDPLFNSLKFLESTVYHFKNLNKLKKSRYIFIFY